MSNTSTLHPVGCLPLKTSCNADEVCDDTLIHNGASSAMNLRVISTSRRQSEARLANELFVDGHRLAINPICVVFHRLELMDGFEKQNGFDAELFRQLFPE